MSPWRACWARAQWEARFSGPCGVTPGGERIHRGGPTMCGLQCHASNRELSPQAPGTREYRGGIKLAFLVPRSPGGSFRRSSQPFTNPNLPAS